MVANEKLWCIFDNNFKIWDKFVYFSIAPYEPRCEKTGLRGF